MYDRSFPGLFQQDKNFQTTRFFINIYAQMYARVHIYFINIKTTLAYFRSSFIKISEQNLRELYEVIISFIFPAKSTERCREHPVDLAHLRCKTFIHSHSIQRNASTAISMATTVYRCVPGRSPLHNKFLIPTLGLNPASPLSCAARAFRALSCHFSTRSLQVPSLLEHVSPLALSSTQLPVEEGPRGWR